MGNRATKCSTKRSHSVEKSSTFSSPCKQDNEKAKVLPDTNDTKLKITDIAIHHTAKLPALSTQDKMESYTIVENEDSRESFVMCSPLSDNNEPIEISSLDTENDIISKSANKNSQQDQVGLVNHGLTPRPSRLNGLKSKDQTSVTFKLKGDISHSVPALDCTKNSQGGVANGYEQLDGNSYKQFADDVESVSASNKVVKELRIPLQNKSNESSQCNGVHENGKTDLAMTEKYAQDMKTILDSFKPDTIDWVPGLVKLTKLIRGPPNDQVYEVVQVLIKMKFLDKFHIYVEKNKLDCSDFPRQGSESLKQTCWSSLKRLLTVIWIACDQNVNFCQQLLMSGQFSFFVNKLKFLHEVEYERDDSKLYTVKACLGILHNVSRHLPNSKWRLRNEGLVTTVQPYLQSNNPMVRFKTLTILSYLLSEAENEMINSNDDNFVFIFEVLSDALKSEDRRSKKYGLAALEILKGLNNLAINDENKLRIVRNDFLDLYESILSTGTSEEIKVAITTLWSLAFHHFNKSRMRDMPGLMDKLCEFQHHDMEEISHAARGTYWELENMSRHSIGQSLSSSVSADVVPGQPHIMISYQWDCQTIMLQVKDRLRAAGYKVWMDVEHMTGSTLEAMALAVEKAAVVLVCMSEKYKNSPNCRTEAEYVYRLRKDFIPLRVQHEYIPDGWLGILVGTRLYFDVYSSRLLDQQIPRLVRELRNRGRISQSSISPEYEGEAVLTKRLMSREAVPVSAPLSSPDVAHWTGQDVQYWIRSHGLDDFIQCEIDGRLLVELSKVQVSAPEYFHRMLRTDFSLPVHMALRFSSVLRKL